MYLYFDKFGTLKEIINDGAVRLGDVNSDTIYIYFEGEPVISGVGLILEKPDKTKTNEYYLWFDMTKREIPYNKDRDLKYFEDYKEYQFYTYTLKSEDLNQSGLYKATIRTLEGSSFKAQGLLTFNVEDGIIKNDECITQSQYDYILENIAGLVDDILSNRFGLLQVSDYNEDTGVITFTYDADVVNNMTYNEATGILTLYYNIHNASIIGGVM